MKKVRKKRGESFHIFGRKPVLEYIQRDSKNVMRVFLSDSMDKGEAQHIRMLAKPHRIPVSTVSQKWMRDYIGDVNTQGVVALVRSFAYQDFDAFVEGLEEGRYGENPSVLILDRIQDTHNFGAILRTAAAAGVAGVIIAKDGQAPVNGTVFKTSAGTALLIPIIRIANIRHAMKRLKKHGFWIASLAMEREGKESQSLWSQSYAETPMAFVLGSEGRGVAQKVVEDSDFIVSIPMENNVESLNVSVATAIVLYEWKRQKEMFLKQE